MKLEAKFYNLLQYDNLTAVHLNKSRLERIISNFKFNEYTKYFYD